MLARFVSADSIIPGQLDKAGTANPQNLNRYSYVNNSPLRYTDPTGHMHGVGQPDGDMGISSSGGAGPEDASGGDDIGIWEGEGGATAPEPASEAAPVEVPNQSAAAQARAAEAGETAGAPTNPTESDGTQSASAPVGRRGNPIEIAPGTNAPRTINGRPYSGHALDRMQGRGIPSSAVENAINTDDDSPGRTGGTTVYNDRMNGVTVVVDDATDRLITVIITKRAK